MICFVLKASESVTKTGNPFVNATLIDSEKRSFPLYVWGATHSDVHANMLVHVDNIQTKGDMNSTQVSSVVEVDRSNYPEFDSYFPDILSIDEYKKVLKDACEYLKPIDGFDVNSQRITIGSLANLTYDLYCQTTASKSNHHAFLGGLLKHTTEILRMFNGIYPTVPFSVNPFIVIVSAILHDYGKIKEYDNTCNYTEILFLTGHSYLGAEAVDNLLPAIPERVRLFIKHCILSHHGQKEFGAAVTPCCPEAFLLSKLDELSGIGVQFDAPTNTQVGSVKLQRF